jgi:hypothetical protein
MSSVMKVPEPVGFQTPEKVQIADLATEDLGRLQTYLSGLPSGPVANRKTLAELLESCWDLFAGSGLEAMADYKLRRMEDPEWDPPCLSFEIERHGRTCMG